MNDGALTAFATSGVDDASAMVGLGASGADVAATLTALEHFAAALHRHVLVLDHDELVALAGRAELTQLCARLRDLLFQLYWRGARCRARRALRVLLENLVDRDARRPFVPSGHWQLPQLSVAPLYTRANGASANNNDDDDDVAEPVAADDNALESSARTRAMRAVLVRLTLWRLRRSLVRPLTDLLCQRHAPFCVAFRERVSVLQTELARAHRHHPRRRHDMFGFGAVSLQIHRSRSVVGQRRACGSASLALLTPRSTVCLPTHSSSCAS